MKDIVFKHAVLLALDACIRLLVCLVLILVKPPTSIVGVEREQGITSEQIQGAIATANKAGTLIGVILQGEVKNVERKRKNR